MNLKFVLGSTLLVAGLFAAAPVVHAEDLMLGQTTVRAVKTPDRGLTMSQVEKRFGAPEAKLAPAGGDTPLHPTINRWKYNGFTVYFERNIVLHSVRDDA
ncbi:MAG: hypothetical protein R3F08_04100 [Dokdonella sp.]|nr:hypothetical protein [Dokdonella sp.]MCB1571373.1 hypothetical protein [Xanthomonadales bacterium]MCB1574978.1 hypothetical protein [Xanthomonadales bacterium]MCB1579098.1 hypothetical protein [Xanthomonadales bacterium]